MDSGNNGHWKAEILPVARFGSNSKKLKQGDRPDLTYDNEALDVLTELFDNADNNIPDDILNAQQDSRTNHTLPDSPPYSGSEAYSPENKLLSPSACSDASNPSSGYHTVSPDPPQTFQPEMTQQQQLHNHLMQQQMQQQQMQRHLHERQLMQQAAMQNGGQLLVPPPMAAVHMQRQHNGVMPQMVPDCQIRNVDGTPPSYSPDQFSGMNKKRKFADSPPMADPQFLQQQQLQQLQVKQEPVVQHQPHTTPPQQQCEFDSEPNVSQSMDISPGMLNGGSYQPIKWREFQKTNWCPLINAQGQRINVQTYRLDGDKGFNFSQIDKAFVCQKKNHFQITSCLSFPDAPQFVMSPEGPKPIEGFFMHFYGVKEEAPNQVIQVDQSQADRSKRKFDPVALHPNPEHSWKVTIGRLHFSDTTLNNMRKRGKPNPDQRYFLLVVGIFAHSQGKEYPVIQQCSEKLIVRASNPGQFQDSEAEPAKWQPGQSPNTVYHSGKVGINTDNPDEALTVAGNVKVMGAIMQPSDRRVKEDITKADTKEQLKNMQAIALYNYRYTEDFADAAGLDNPKAVETGVIAQELEVVIPEAVKTTSDVRLPSGEVIDKLKVVDKNRLFMESIGAVKELCNVTDSLENKINYLERFNQKLKKLKRIGSMRSTASNESDLSRVTSISTVSHVAVSRKQRKDKCTPAAAAKAKEVAGSAPGVCSNKFLQLLIIILIVVMVACVGVIVAMVLLDKTATHTTVTQRPPKAPSSTVPDLSGGPTSTTTIHPLDNNPANWLIGVGCDEMECEKTHCTNKCPKLFNNIADLNPNLTRLVPTTPAPEEDKEFGVVLDTTIPQDVGSAFSYKMGTPKRRRKRNTGVQNPATAMKIALTSPVPFDIDERRCLECEEGSFNYTYGVQVSDTFPGTNAVLHIGLKAGNLMKPWQNVVLCDTPTEPSNFYDKTCKGEFSDVDRFFNVTPEYDTEVKPIRHVLGVDYDVEVGKVFKNVAIFRLTDYQNRSQEELCTAPLTKHLIEFRIWFIRACYNNPMSISSLRQIVEIAQPSFPGIAEDGKSV